MSGQVYSVIPSTRSGLGLAIVTAAYFLLVKVKGSEPNQCKVKGLKMGAALIHRLVMLIMLCPGTKGGNVEPPNSPRVTVFDATGEYSGIAPMIKTISLTQVEECSKARRTYLDPQKSELQILNPRAP